MAIGGVYARGEPRTLPGVPRSWQISMVILVLALVASMVIATIKLI